LENQVKATVRVNKNNLPLAIGNHQPGKLSNPFKGMIATPFIYHYVMSDEEILARFLQALKITRPANEYENYIIENPQNSLIIINTNGYGYFAKKLFRELNKNISINAIYVDNRTIEMPITITIPGRRLMTKDAEIIGFYKVEEDVQTIIPLAIRKGSLLYINIYPIISQLKKLKHDDNIKHLFFNILGMILGSLLPVTKYSSTIYDDRKLSEWDAEFKEAYLEGNILIRASSIIFPPGITRVQRLIINNNKIYHNVSYISISNYEYIIIKATKVNVSHGFGSYAMLTIGNMSVEPNGDVNVSFISYDGIISCKNVSKLMIIVENSIPVIVKNPSIEAFGKIIFKKLYTFAPREPWGSLPREAELHGGDLLFEGHTSFTILVSDIVTIVDNLNLIIRSSSRKFIKSPQENSPSLVGR